MLDPKALAELRFMLVLINAEGSEHYRRAVQASAKGDLRTAGYFFGASNASKDIVRRIRNLLRNYT